MKNLQRKFLSTEYVIGRHSALPSGIIQPYDGILHTNIRSLCIYNLLWSNMVFSRYYLLFKRCLVARLYCLYVHRLTDLHKMLSVPE